MQSNRGVRVKCQGKSELNRFLYFVSALILALDPDPLLADPLLAVNGIPAMETLPTINSLWDFSDPASSEARFRDLARQAKAVGNAGYELEAITQLARSLGLQRKFDDAQAVLDDVKPRLSNDMIMAKARWHLEQGRVLNSSNHPAESIPHFEKALKFAETAKSEYLAIDAAHMLGIVEAPARAIQWNEKAILMAEAATDPKARGWLGSLYNNLAWTYSDVGEYEKALALFTKDVAYRESQNKPFEASIARWSTANTLRKLGRVKEALEIQMALVSHPLRQGNAAEGYTHEEIAECLLLLNRADEARPHFKIAYERLREDPWLQANEKDRLDRLKELAE